MDSLFANETLETLKIFKNFTSIGYSNLFHHGKSVDLKEFLINTTMNDNDSNDSNDNNLNGKNDSQNQTKNSNYLLYFLLSSRGYKAYEIFNNLKVLSSNATNHAIYLVNVN